MSNIKHVRSRYSKPNSSDFILSTNNFQSNEKDNDIRLIIRNKHNKIQIIFMILTAFVYLLHTLRAYIPATNSYFWSNLVIRSITRVYTSDLRPNIIIENLLFRLAENWQTFWLLYILSYIPRRTHLGYVYRNLNIFNTFLCCLLINALVLQIISQLSISPEISCVCLYISLICLIIISRTVAIKINLLNKYKSTELSIDLIILRYFVLNSLFLYTTFIFYLIMCATIEYIGIYLDPNAIIPKIINTCTTIGLFIVWIFIFIYFLFDQFIYVNEFWSIWTPYFFIAYVFICPPLRQLSLLENDFISNNFNYYLFWILFSSTILFILIRFYRQISIIYWQRKKENTY